MESVKKINVKKRYTPQEKQAIIESWKQSGKTQREFCREHGVNYHTLIFWITPKKKWKKELVKAEGKHESFSEVKMSSSARVNVFASISFGKTAVEFYQPVSADYLRRLLSA